MNFFICELFRDFYKMKVNQIERDELIQISKDAYTFPQEVFLHIALEKANKNKLALATERKNATFLGLEKNANC